LCNRHCSAAFRSLRPIHSMWPVPHNENSAGNWSTPPRFTIRNTFLEVEEFDSGDFPAVFAKQVSEPATPFARQESEDATISTTTGCGTSMGRQESSCTVPFDTISQTASHDFAPNTATTNHVAAPFYKCQQGNAAYYAPQLMESFNVGNTWGQNSQDAHEQFCPQCGAFAAPEHRFCPHCSCSFNRTSNFKNGFVASVNVQVASVPQWHPQRRVAGKEGVHSHTVSAVAELLPNLRRFRYTEASQSDVAQMLQVLYISKGRFQPGLCRA
jgi:hypothetical protein